jgi:hypothetical protein
MKRWLVSGWTLVKGSIAIVVIGLLLLLAYRGFMRNMGEPLWRWWTS